MSTARKRYVPAVGPGLNKLLFFLFGAFALLGVNSVYLVSITVLEWWRAETYQNYFYQLMFLGHLVLGAAMIAPFLVFGILHIRNAHDRPNRRAVRAGYALFAASAALLFTGVILTRLEGFEVRDPALRSGAYWVHVVSPLVVMWLFVLHRLAGKRIQWKIGGVWLAVAGGVAIAMTLLHAQDPRQWNQVGPESGEQYFFPSLARTADGNFISAETMQMDAYCAECHADIHADWEDSVHRLASFNNPAYLASVRATRAAMLERDGTVQGARFCAGCHDPVPFFSGAFDDPDFDDVGHPTAQAGITCTGCHAITHVNSVRGNADYTIEEPSHYPFARSENSVLAWINRQLVKAKPAFHKKTFLKPLHRSTEFCGTCHKVHLPEELNDYKWLRGQNHYDSFWLSGVSGQGAQSFYYPPVAEKNCNGCHMPLMASDDFGAARFDDSGELKVHRHLFPSANTAIPFLVGRDGSVIEEHRKFNEGAVRVDLFGLRADGAIDGALTAPLGPVIPALEPGAEYLLEAVIRTVKLGHLLTQGTADSNELWLELVVRDGDRVVGCSGGRASDGRVDEWSHFVNAFVLDRKGNRIARRNAEDIFIPLYNHQIPPGAADSVHYRLKVPDDVSGPLTVQARLHYRKFDTEYLRFFQDDPEAENDLPVILLAEDEIVFPIDSAGSETDEQIVLWQRWNDYGIGLLRKGTAGNNKGQLRQAEEAFREVELLGRPDGPLNLARVYIVEGRLDEAVAALGRAAAMDPPAPAWSVAWFSGVVDKQNGFLDEAIANFRTLLEMDTEETRTRGFDFSKDYRIWTELGQTLVERSKQERGEARQAEREALQEEARQAFLRALELDPEDLSSHFNLTLLAELAGDTERAAEHRVLYERYKPDDNARGSAVAAARRRYPAADHAAEAVVIYDLHRAGAFGLDGAEPEGTK